MEHKEINQLVENITFSNRKTDSAYLSDPDRHEISRKEMLRCALSTETENLYGKLYVPIKSLGAIFSKLHDKSKSGMDHRFENRRIRDT